MKRSHSEAEEAKATSSPHKRTKAADNISSHSNGHVIADPALTVRCIDTIRVVAADTVEMGKSGIDLMWIYCSF